MDRNIEFEKEVLINITGLSEDEMLKKLSAEWNFASARHRYTYNFRYLGRPIIQFPQDMISTQELIWKVRPDLVIETGIAHGGSLMLSASMLTLLDYCDAVQSGKTLDPSASRRRVLGLDIDIRAHNRVAIESHPLAHKIKMIQGSSIASEIISQVYEFANGYECILVILDSNHTHSHVLAELEAYAPLVSKNSYCVVFDTIIEDAADFITSDRPWGKGNNPKTAVWEFLHCLENDGRAAADGEPLHFEIDKQIENKLLITVAPDGYLKRV